MASIIALVIVQIAIMLATSRFWGSPPTLARVLTATLVGIALATLVRMVWGTVFGYPDSEGAYAAMTIVLISISVGLVTKGRAAVQHHAHPA